MGKGHYFQLWLHNRITAVFFIVLGVRPSHRYFFNAVCNQSQEPLIESILKNLEPSRWTKGRKVGATVGREKRKMMAHNQTDCRTLPFCPGADLVTITRQFANTPGFWLLSNFHEFSGPPHKILQLENLTYNGS